MRRFIVQVLLLLAALDLVERRLGDVEVAALDQSASSAGRRRSAAG